MKHVTRTKAKQQASALAAEQLEVSRQQPIFELWRFYGAIKSDEAVSDRRLHQNAETGPGHVWPALVSSAEAAA